MKIAFVGLGVVGASMALGLKNNDKYELLGVDILNDTLNYAIDKGIIKEGSTNPQDILRKADLTVISIYPNDTVTFMKNNIEYFKENSIVMDMVGVKTELINGIIPIIHDKIDFVFSHPMAGKEKSGIKYASENINKNANFLITPTEKNKEKNISLVESVIKDAGFGKISKISPEMHDNMIAYTSQLTHTLAVALINSKDFTEDTGKFVGDSFRDLTRIASMNEDLWAELFFLNKDFLVAAMDNFEAEIRKIKYAVLKEDDNTLKDLFRKSTKRRNSL